MSTQDKPDHSKLIYQKINTIDGTDYIRITALFTKDNKRFDFVDGTGVQCFAVDNQDLSPQVIISPDDDNHRPFSNKCSHCFLGEFHTIALHDKLVGK